MRLDMARAQKENQKKPDSAAPTKGLSAVSRTLVMYKHKCIHCGALDPCVPETLVAVASGAEQSSAPGIDASTVTVEPLDDAQATLSGVGAYTDEELEELEQEETAWRHAIQKETASG